MASRTKKRLANDSNLLKEASKDLMDSLKEMGVKEKIIFDIRVGFEEALRNAMIHGNKSCSDKCVMVETEVTPEEAVIIIEDEGEGFNHSKVPDPTEKENLLKEGGRGVYLIKHLMDEVSYENEGRRVVMKKRLKSQ